MSRRFCSGKVDNEEASNANPEDKKSSVSKADKKECSEADPKEDNTSAITASAGSDAAPEGDGPASSANPEDKSSSASEADKKECSEANPKEDNTSASTASAGADAAPEGNGPAAQVVLDSRLHASSQGRPPASWENPRQWVDLEFEQAGLAHNNGPEIESQWGSPEFQTPDSNVLWPHRALDEHRRRPFRPPHDADEGIDLQKQLETNKNRLQMLWQYSSSHGISWDELDEAYLQFAAMGKQKHKEWIKGDESTQYTPKRLVAKDCAQKKAQKLMARIYDKMEKEDIEKMASEDRLQTIHSGRTKRLASRFYREEKKRLLYPWRPGRLEGYLQQFVAAKMLRRETAERRLGYSRMSTSG